MTCGCRYACALSNFRDREVNTPVSFKAEEERSNLKIEVRTRQLPLAYLIHSTRGKMVGELEMYDVR